MTGHGTHCNCMMCTIGKSVGMIKKTMITKTESKLLLIINFTYIKWQKLPYIQRRHVLIVLC
jgi:hypothetical protein